MARVCDLTGTKTFSGNKVSHSNIKTRTKWLPNLHDKRFMVPELSKVVTFKLSTRAIRTIDKLGGISQAIMKEVFLERIVIPRSFSKSPESITLSVTA